MKIPLVLLAAALTAGCVSGPGPAGYGQRDWASTVSGGWTRTSRLAARRLVDKYGAPERVEPGRLVWLDKGPWRRLVARDLPPLWGGTACVTGEVSYRVPPEKRAELAAFGAGVGSELSIGDGTLAASASREELDFLALNLADEIVKGLRDVAAARAFYGRALELEAAGKTSIYMQGLLFLPP